jgi:hypothetical protein
MLALFQCASIAMIFIVMSFRVQVFECEPWRYHQTV